MDLNHLQVDLDVAEISNLESNQPDLVSIETELPEVLYEGMKEFVSSNPKWDQYKLLSSAVANFLFQNGCEDRAVTESYLNDLFKRSEL